MSNDKKTIEKLTSRVKIYLIIIALLFILICTYDTAWIIPSILFYALIIGYTIWSNTKKKTEIETHIEEVAWGMNSTVRNTLNKSSIPLLVIETDGDIIYKSPKFNKEFKDVDVITYVESLIKEIKLEIENNTDKKEFSKQMTIENKVYKVLCEYGISKKRDKRKQKEYVLTLTFIDETKYNTLFDQYINEKMCICIAVIDNYEELIQKLSPEEKPTVLAKIDKTIYDWASSSGGLVIKNERDTYIFLFEQKYLADIEKNKIAVLDLVKEIDVKTPITLSISISNEEKSYYERYKSALDGIDLVLGRGGDQCIVRKEGKYKFYGGTSLEVEKRTKVKARIVAHTIEELIQEARNVIIMGHQNIDIDALGSSMGMYRLAKTIGKPAYIIAQDLGMNLGKFIDTLKDTEYEQAIIDKKEALTLIDKDTLLIVVDTHKKSFVQAPELLNKTDKIVVIDHHRKSTDFIDNATLTFQEVYASSAAELVTEIIQYVDRKVELTQTEIESLYGGIMVDTKNFTFKTGVRTFEAAAYLRKFGVDIIKVKKWFQADLESYNVIADIVKNADMISDSIAISVYEEAGKDANTICAKAADELLTISNITASFVLGNTGDNICISGRSIGDINVQLILEKLGGGGHITLAGAQLENVSLEEAKTELINRINEYFSEIND
ncbi:MAG: DHH family phosphoesterase [Clostridia bacterium]|nr:DHH family phosphoesterase [Clostridia bacterium]